jgi:hypothetical protein
MPGQRMKKTRYERLEDARKNEKRKHYRKKPTEITQQPSKKRDCYAGRCSWEWLSGPERGKKFNQPVSLPYPFTLKLRGKDLVVRPDEGEEFVWGEAQSDETKKAREKADQEPLDAEKGSRVKSMLALLREKLEALIEEKGPREGGKSFARGFILAHNKMSTKKAKLALAKLYAAVLKDSNRAAFLSFGAHLRSSVSMTKKTKAAVDLSAAHALIASGGEIGDNTLGQLVGMAAESMLDGEARYLLSSVARGATDAPREVEKAARDYESAAEDVLTEIAGGAAAQEAMSNDAPYLMFMTQEGHGVGIHDGELDNIEGLDLKVLSKKLDNHTALGSAYARLRNTIEESAWEEINEAMTELVEAANDAVSEEFDDREEQETDPNGSTAGEVAGFLGDQITYTYNDLKRFSEDETRDRYNGDLAEAVAAAFEAGHDERDIFKAIQDVGEVEWVRGIGATRGFSLSGGGSDEVELQVSAKDTEVSNPWGDDTNVAQIVKVLGEMGDIDVKFNYEIKGDDITDHRSLDGYWNFDVDPRALRRKLRIK